MSAQPATPGRHAVRSAAIAAAVCWAARRLLGAAAGGGGRWTRANHRGEPVSLLEGPAVAAGLLASVLFGGTPRVAAAGATAVAGAAAFGLLDDLSEDTGLARKGLRGHLGALVRGEVTTGALKLLGIGATSLVAAAVATPHADGERRLTRAVDLVTSGALIAATANLVNLLDLRPGRALKAVGLAAAPLLGTPGAAAAGACLGAAAAAAGPDLAEHDMLGDGGANALGALLGTAAVLGVARPARLGLLAAAVGLTVASERVSFTQVISRTSVLRQIDAWGRRP